METNLQQCLEKNKSRLDKLGKWEKFHKVYLSYHSGRGWKIQNVNIFKFIIIKIFGGYSSLHLKKVLQHIKAEKKEFTALPFNQANVIFQLENQWIKKHHTPPPEIDFDFKKASDQIVNLLDIVI